MPGPVSHTLRDIKEMFEDLGGVDWFPLDEGYQIDEMVEGMKPFLSDLSSLVEGTRLRGILLKTCVTEGTYLLSKEGKFYQVKEGSSAEVTYTGIAEAVGVLEVGKALASAITSRLEQHNTLAEMWEETLDKARKLTER